MTESEDKKGDDYVTKGCALMLTIVIAIFFTAFAARIGWDAGSLRWTKKFIEQHIEGSGTDAR